MGVVEFFAEADGVAAAAWADPDQPEIRAVEAESAVFGAMVTMAQNAQIVFDGGAVVFPGGDVIDVGLVRGAAAAGGLAVPVPGLHERFLLCRGPVVQASFVDDAAVVGEAEPPHCDVAEVVGDLAGLSGVSLSTTSMSLT